MNSRGYEGGAVHPGPQETVGPFRQPHAGEARIELSQPLEAKLDRLIGMLSRHDEGWWKTALVQVTANPGLTAGTKLLADVALANDCQAHTLIIDNPTGYTLLVDAMARRVPPNTLGYPMVVRPALNKLNITVLSGTQAAADTVTVYATENPHPPVGWQSSQGAGAVTITGQPIAENLTQVGGAAVALGQTTMAASIPVTIASNQSPVSENLAQMNGVAVSSPTATNGYVQVAEKGTNNENQLQQTSTAASAQIGAARATLKRRRLRNLDAANSIWYREGAAATTTSAILKAGESADIFSLLAVNIIDNGSHAVVQLEEWYD